MKQTKSVKKTHLRYCFGAGAETARFQASMAEFRRTESANPDCLENCDEVEFDVFVTSNPVNPEEACAGENGGNLLGLAADSEWRRYEERRVRWRIESAEAAKDGGTQAAFCRHKVAHDLGRIMHDQSSLSEVITNFQVEFDENPTIQHNFLIMRSYNEENLLPDRKSSAISLFLAN